MQYILVGYTDVPTKFIDETSLLVGDRGGEIILFTHAHNKLEDKIEYN